MTFQNKLHCPHCPVRHPPRPVSVCGGHSITRVRCRMNAAFRRSVQVRPVFIQSQVEHFQLLRSAGSPVPHCGVQATFQSPLSYGWNTGQECPANPQTRMSALPERWNRSSFCILPSPRKSGVPIFAMDLVGTARPPSAALLRPSSAVALLRRMERTGCAVRAAQQRRNVGAWFARLAWFVPPAGRGREHHSAMSLPKVDSVGTVRCAVPRRVQRRNEYGGGVRTSRVRSSFRPLFRGRGRRSAPSLPKAGGNLKINSVPTARQFSRPRAK